jgi:hypothetical protein
MTTQENFEEHNKPSADFISAILNGKDEMNLAEFPIARLGYHDTRLSIEYRGQIVDKSGNVLDQKWIVDGSPTFGLPTEFADRVLVALISISGQDQFSNRKVPFTIYRVLTLLGLPTNKEHYKTTKRALQQLAGVTIYSEGAFWDKAKQKRITTEKGFHILEEFWLKSMETDDDVIEEESVNGYIVWSERIWESFKAGYIKHLDTAFYYSLEKTIARRLYRFLDKRMHYQNTYQIDVFDLAARLGMKPYRYASEVIDKMKDSFEELKQRGYLQSVEVIKVGKFTRVKFTRTGADTPTQGSLFLEPSVVDAPPTANTANDPLAALYAQHGTSDELKAIWDDILLELKQSMPSASYLTIAHSALLAVQEGRAVIGVPARMLDWAERQLRRKILTGLSISLKTKITELSFCPLP